MVIDNKDTLQQFFFENAPVRGEIARLNESYQEIIQQHPYPALIRHLLGEALVVACLLSAMLKVTGRVTVQFHGKGKLKLLLAQCDHQAHLRGIVQYESELTQAELLAAQQEGILSIMIDFDVPYAKNYQGIVAWEGVSLAQAIEGYFRQSEQLPTRLWLAVNETSAAGLLLQVLPKERPELFKNDWEHLIMLTETLTPQEFLQIDNATLLHRLYSQEELRILTQKSVIFQCTCSLKRSQNAILLLGEEEAEQELKDKQRISVICEFCNKEYSFDRVDVAAIFKQQGGELLSSTQLH
ncbi:MAG: hslO [Gammaproteobacteria bacterium]|jgi:molecular chaperone Hsp33|nr:hslO [Gammaproteobacteria bacterium]